MTKHCTKEWMLAVRPWSYPASTMPIIVTATYLAWKGISLGNWWMAVYALLNIILLHSAGNAWSDYKDFTKGVDSHESYGQHVLTAGIFRADEIKRLSLCLLAAGTLMGIGLIFLCQHLYGEWLTLLYIGLGGVLSALVYPICKYNALGDLIILIAYAVLPTLGTSFILTGQIDWTVLLLALPLGLITDGILHTNNTRDIPTDKEASIHTLPMIIGHKASAIWYFTEMMIPYVWVGVLSMFGIFPVWTVFIFLTFPVAIGNGRMMMKSLRCGLDVIANLDISTAKLQLLFSLILSFAFILGIFI